MLIYEHGYGITVSVFWELSPGLKNYLKLLFFNFITESPEEELEIISMSSLLSVLFSFIVKNNSVP